MTPTETKAPLLDEVIEAIGVIERRLPTGITMPENKLPNALKTIRAHIAALEEDNKRLREALEWIKANWSNQDICHTDFRVRSFVEANAALEDGKDGE